MIDRRLLRLAFRARASSLVVATTGVTTLAATATGYTRTAGSFLTDGFLVGQDVTPSGFPQTDVGVITAVSALSLTIAGGRTVAAAMSGRSLVSGLPTMRAWQNIGLTPIVGRPYVIEALPFGGSSVRTIPTRTGRLEQDGLSVWTWYGVAGVGSDAIDAGVTALMKRLAPYTHFALADGTTVDMRGDVGPSSTDVVSEAGFSRCTVTLPWRATSRNAVLT
jgi:hypothetical protein